MTATTVTHRRPARVSPLEEARSLAVRAHALQTSTVAGTGAVKVRQALDTARRDRALPTSPAIAALLPGGTLRGGASYCVQGSTALAMAMMAGPSAAGAWCAVVGLPAFGAEAAEALGVDLERLVLVPQPGGEWLGVVAALLDALTVVVVAPPADVTSGEVSRLAARMRQRGAVLVVAGSWPGSEARLAVSDDSWAGLGSGYGHLSARQVTVLVSGRGAATRPRRHQLWLPDADGFVRAVEQHDAAEQQHDAAEQQHGAAEQQPGHGQPAWRHEAVS